MLFDVKDIGSLDGRLSARIKGFQDRKLRIRLRVHSNTREGIMGLFGGRKRVTIWVH